MTEVPFPDFCESTDPGSAVPSGSILVEVNIPDERWLEQLPGLAALAGETARDAFLAGCGWVGNAGVEISLTFTDDAFIEGLNAKHRNIQKPTNVLSFPAIPSEEVQEAVEQLQGNAEAAPPELLLGDVVLAFETIMREAEEQQKRPADHAAHLVAHGVLHLLGFDHDQEAAATRMEGLEIGIMENLGIGNPYDTARNAGTAPAFLSGQGEVL